MMYGTSDVNRVTSLNYYIQKKNIQRYFFCCIIYFQMPYVVFNKNNMADTKLQFKGSTSVQNFSFANNFLISLSTFPAMEGPLLAKFAHLLNICMYLYTSINILLEVWSKWIHICTGIWTFLWPRLYQHTTLYLHELSVKQYLLYNLFWHGKFSIRFNVLIENLN